MSSVRRYLQFLSNNWGLLGFGFLAVFWGNFGQSFFIAWFGAEIQRDLGLSASHYGAAYSVATLASAATVIWLGGMIDRMALRRYALLVAFGLAVATAALSQAQGLLTLLLGFFLLRLFGQALLPHTGITTMARLFAQARGKALSVAMSGVPVGEIVLPIVAVALVAMIGWQFTFLLVSLLTVVFLMPMFSWLLRRGLPDAGRSVDHRQETSDGSSVGLAPGPGRGEVLADYRFWLALPALMTGPFLITGIFIHQNFLVEQKGWTLSWLASSFVAYGVTHWLSSLLAGALVDRFSVLRLLPFMLLPMLAAITVAAWLPGWWSAPLMMVLLGMAAGGAPPITGSLWPMIYGTARLGAIRSMNMAIMVMATSVSPVLFGYFIDDGMSAAMLFGACAVYVLLALLLLLFSYPLNGRSLVVDSFDPSEAKS